MRLFEAISAAAYIRAWQKIPIAPVNAVLNYAYAVLQSQLQIQAVAEGYDPNLGIMHVDREYGPPFVFDLMEPERPKVDRAMMEFLKSETLHPEDFVIRTDGVVRLNLQLARYIVGVFHLSGLRSMRFDVVALLISWPQRMSRECSS